MTRTITVHDAFQDGYTYECTEPVGKNFHPDFTPELTPQEMLELGVFEGDYFGEVPEEFPTKWFAKAKIAEWEKDPSLNFFKVAASKPLEYWEEKGWIREQDPLGWFQWYCRYYLGRRSPDDERQIKRWKAISRHIAQVKKNCEQGDLSCRPKQRQALLHWAVDSRRL